MIEHRQVLYLGEGDVPVTPLGQQLQQLRECRIGRRRQRRGHGQDGRARRQQRAPGRARACGAQAPAPPASGPLRVSPAQLPAPCQKS